MNTGPWLVNLIVTAMTKDTGKKTVRAISEPTMSRVLLSKGDHMRYVLRGRNDTRYVLSGRIYIMASWCVRVGSPDFNDEAICRAAEMQPRANATLLISRGTSSICLAHSSEK